MPEKKIKNGFYQEFAQKREQERQEEFYRKQYSVPPCKPLIIDPSPAVSAKVLNWVTDTLRIVGRVQGKWRTRQQPVYPAGGRPHRLSKRR